jgi:hypothetical protein
MITKPCPLHDDTLTLFQLLPGQPMRIVPAPAQPTPEQGNWYFWAVHEADLWAFVDVEAHGFSHPVWQWDAAVDGAPHAGGLE